MNKKYELTSEKITCPSCGATVAIPDRMTAAQAARVLARRAAAAPPSPARQAASRANGRKGGRPRRRPTTGKENDNKTWCVLHTSYGPICIKSDAEGTK